MTKEEIKKTKKLIKALYDQIEMLENSINESSKQEITVNTNLENRNYDVFICKKYLYMDYDQIANALNISKAQVGESLKVLRDRGLVESRRKKTTKIDENLKEVKKLHAKGLNRYQIAKELKISNQTVIRCLDRINNEL